MDNLNVASTDVAPAGDVSTDVEAGLEFENGVAFDDHTGETFIEFDAPAEANPPAGTDKLGTQDPPKEAVTPANQPTELDIIKTQMQTMQQQLAMKDQIMAMAKAKLEELASQQKAQVNTQLPDNFDFLETFSDKAKGQQFLDAYVSAQIQQRVGGALNQLPAIVQNIMQEQQKANFKSNNKEAFDEAGFLKQEVYDKMAPLLQKYPNMSLEDAYAPHRDYFKARVRAAQAVNTNKAQKLKNTNNQGSAATLDPVQKAIKSMEDAWKAAEREIQAKR